MRNLRTSCSAVILAALLTGALSGVAAADPVSNPTSIPLTAVCDNGESYTFLVSPASGHAVLDTSSTTVQVTFSLTVNDPLGEIGGSFTVPLSSKIPLRKLTNCSGTVIGTSAVTYSAQVLITPSR